MRSPKPRATHAHHPHHCVHTTAHTTDAACPCLSARDPRLRSEAELEGILLHKARPETEAEKAACTQELCKADINRIVVGPKVGWRVPQLSVGLARSTWRAQATVFSC